MAASVLNPSNDDDSALDTLNAARKDNAGMPAMVLLDLVKSGRAVFGLRSEKENAGAKGAAKFRKQMESSVSVIAVAAATRPQPKAAKPVPMKLAA